VDRITEQLSQLQELTNEQLAELEELVLNEFSAAEQQELTSQSVAQLTQLADAVEAVRAEQARRATEAQALQEAAAEAAARVKGPEASADENAMAPAEDPEDAIDGGADESTEPDAPVPPADEPESVDNPTEEQVPGEEYKKKPVPVVASADEAAAEEPVEAEAAAEDAPETEAAVEQPEGSEAAVEEAAVEEPVEAEAAVEEAAEAAVEAPAEAEASAEAPVEAEAAVEEGAEASVETPTEAEAALEETNETNTEATVTAAANGSEGSLNIEPPADRKPLPKPATTLTITAGADVPGITAGTVLNNDLEVADAFMRRLHSLRHVHGGDGEQHIVASIVQEFPEDRFLTQSDALENNTRIQNVTSTEAITAAAGICLPLETKYDLGCDVGVTDRPVRDALARFGADRGGIRYFTAPTLSQADPAFANATGFWRGDGSDPNSGTWHTYGPDRTTQTSPADAKPCLEMNCVEENTAYIEAITLCLTFNNLTTRTFPELVKRQNELALVAHARVAENALLAQLEAGSTAITAQAQVVGATREILNLLDRAVASYRFKHRMSTSSPLRGVFPSWVRNLLRADLALQMPGDGMEVFNLADSQIDNWFRSRNVNATWHLDGVGPAAADLDGAGSGTAVGFELPTSIEFGLWAEGTWLFLDGGTLDLGIIRDSSLVATNQYKQFVESFEGVANVGCDSYWVTAAYEPSGQAASLVDTLA
jgi:hypothetical protein